MNHPAAVRAATAFTIEHQVVSIVAKLPYSDLHIVVDSEEYLAQHIPGAVVTDTIRPEDVYRSGPIIEMVAYMIEEGHSVIAQYAEDREEYATEEVYNYWIAKGRKAILEQIAGWFENEIEACNDAEAEGECPHRDNPETCEECQRLGALVEKYAEYRDESYDA